MDYPFFCSIQSYHFCDLLIAQEELVRAQHTAEISLGIGRRHHWVLAIGLDTLTLGRIAWQRAAAGNEAARTEAAEHLQDAVKLLRRSASRPELLWGLLARAALHRLTGAWLAAWRDLEEVREIAERGDMKLPLADCHLEGSRLFACVAKAKGEPAISIQELWRELHSGLLASAASAPQSPCRSLQPSWPWPANTSSLPAVSWRK